MSPVSRRLFLTTAAGAAGAVGVGAALPATAGAQTPVAAGGSTGTRPLAGPGFMGVQAPAGSTATAGRVRFATPQGWTDWIGFPHADGGRSAAPATASGLVATPAGATDYEVEAAPGATPVFAATALSQPAASDRDVRGTGELAGVNKYAQLPTVDCYGIPVVPRAAWGCDESISFGSIEYRPAQAITVHHSVSPAAWDPASTMRGFHRYHTLSNGWGDIGYHLVIDPSGQVYQGHRTHAGYPVFGGPMPPGVRPDVVMGAHVGGHNSGNVGVCLMGDFSSGRPSLAAYAALANVLAKLCAAIGLNPFQGIRYWNPDGNYGRDMQAINGHRDWMSTDCPGDMLWNSLPLVRQATAHVMSTGQAFPTSAWLPNGSSGS